MTAAPPLPTKLTESLALIRSLGVTLTDAEIVWLAELRRLADTPPGRANLSSSSSPVEICGVKLWPMHMIAECWSSDWVREFEGDPFLQNCIYLFAFAKSEPMDRTLVSIATYDAVKKAVVEWISSTTIMRKDVPQIIDACCKLMETDFAATVENPDKVQTVANAPKTAEERAAALCKMFPGTTPDYWLFGVSTACALKMAIEVSRSGESSEWAQSPVRIKRVASYLAAVKILARRAGNVG
jgi:hypothetical protein